MSRFPRCKEAGVPVKYSDHGTPHVTPFSLMACVTRNEFPKKGFDNLSRIPINGVSCYFAWEVEFQLSVLLRPKDREKINKFRSFLTKNQKEQ